MVAFIQLILQQFSPAVDPVYFDIDFSAHHIFSLKSEGLFMHLLIL